MSDHLLKVNSLNVRGLRDQQKRCTLFRWLKHTHEGIEFLQECHSEPRDEKKWIREWGGEIVFSHGSRKSRGVAIMLDKSYDYEIKTVERDEEGRFLLLDINIENKSLILVNIYAPTSDDTVKQCEFLQFISNKLETYIDRDLILGGDFNMCPDPVIDRNASKFKQTLKVTESFQTFRDNLNLIDIWRVLNDDMKRYTWRGNTKSGRASSRIDLWLVSSNIVFDLENTKISSSILTDHSIINLNLNLKEEQKRGNGNWKLNVSLLKDQQLVNKINTYLDSCTNTYRNIENKALVWDTIKCGIRGIIIKCSKLKRRQEREQLDNLKNDLNIIEEKMDKTDHDEQLYKTVKIQIEEIEKRHANGAIVRSRAQWIEDGEKCTSYFLKLEKRNQKNKSIKCLSDSGKKHYDQTTILNLCKNFYKNLYSQTQPTNFDSCKLFNVEHNVLSENEQEICEGRVSEAECLQALKLLPNNKTPGSDGLSIDFYKFFWNKIKTFLISSFDYSFENNLLSIDQRRAILTLLPKPSKDSRNLKNWRPISLLNSDYKILAKVLANRLQKVISNIIHPDQVGYIKGRNISDNIRSMIDVLSITKNEINPGIILLIDFEKAFDSIAWSFLFESLKLFNFGETFMRYIKLLYSSPLCCVTNNGYNSEYFELTRGIRQGCPISALLFLLCAEVLACNIRGNREIEGITLRQNEIKITQFADDTCLYLKDIPSLEKVLIIFESFYRYAGLRLNKEKSEIIWLGKTERVGNIENISIQNNPTKALGIWLCKDENLITKHNIESKVLKIKSLLNIWKQRNLTIKGRVTILKSQALPIITFVASCLHIPDHCIEQIERLFFEFLWPNKKHHVKKKTVIESIENGGIKMPDVSSYIKSLHIMWLKRLLLKTSCSPTVEYILQTKDIARFLQLKNNVKFLGRIPSFYKECLNDWYKLHNQPPLTGCEVLSETIWGNEFILIDSKPVKNHIWRSHGIENIYHLLNGNGYFKTIEHLYQDFNLRVSVMLYNSIKAAIPQEWLRLVRENVDCIIHFPLPINLNLNLKLGNKTTTLKQCTNKELYDEYISKKSIRPSSYERWETDYYYANFDWNLITVIPYQCARETYLQSLQYQIINCYFPTNKMLHLWKKEPTPNCRYCDSIDSLEHYFYFCARSQAFWERVKQWFAEKFDFIINFGALDILLGMPNPTKSSELMALNFVILFAKQFIKRSKQEDQALSFVMFVNKFNQRLKIEEHICITNGKLESFNIIWGNYLHHA